CQKCTTTPFTF
nr:immunoglobulin light chain junction region [Macaca mulatta]MOW13510.1 immunoglobulin light chain junction region [Macaca mulatta]